MSYCNEHRARITFYLDDELSADEKAALEAHLGGCAACREVFNRERWFLGSIRRVGPLYVAPEGLRARVAGIVGNDEDARSARSRTLWRRLFADRRQLLAAMATLVLVITLVGGFVATLVPPELPQPSAFSQMAVDVHRRHRLGQLPLELLSDVPATVSGWFDGKVPFDLALPDYQSMSGQEKLYRLEGARLVGFNNDYAAYVAYRMARRPISLVVTSSSVAQPAGGAQVTSKGLVFHYDTIDGLKVITWSHRGLTYALVSDLEERGQQSCLVCHQGTKDRDFIEGLTPPGSAI